AAASPFGRYHAHGTATRHNDRMEARVYSTLFGERRVVVQATKGSIGHTLGAAGALDVVAAVVGLSRGIAFPTVGLRVVDPTMKIAPVLLEPRPDDSTRALVCSAGFGGIDAAVSI